jgi:hypothetical protein
MNTLIYKTREDWLEHAIKLLTPLFAQRGYPGVPRVRVACGWPSSRGTSAKKRTVGQCWAPEAATDGVSQIFISPYLDDIAGPQGVLATLVHEVIHAVVGLEAKHGKVFRKCAEAVGLEGKMTATNANEMLCKQQVEWAAKLGEYPHAKLDLLKSPVKKQTTRMHKAECDECGYTVRLSQKWLDEVGSPHCPKHGAMQVEVKFQDMFPDKPNEN